MWADGAAALTCPRKAIIHKGIAVSGLGLSPGFFFASDFSLHYQRL